MEPRHKRNTAMRILIAFWAVLALLAFVISAVSFPPVSQSKIKRLNLGMSTNQVQTVLGTPSLAVTATDGSRLWEYNRFSWRTFSAHFDASGHLVAFETD